MIFCVTVTNAFLPRAKVLARSIKQHHPDSRVIVGYTEREINPDAASYPFFDDIVPAKDWGHPHFEKLIFQHPVYAAQCALRPSFLKYMLYAYPGEKIICMGADTKVYSPLQELEAALDEHPMVLTTHQVEKTYDGWYKTVGMYNGDLLAFCNGEKAHRYCDWMGDRMMNYCYIDTNQSLFLDQSWLKFAPIFFQSRALMHPGYNMAFWNIYEPCRQLRTDADGTYKTANGDNLRFFHFSNLSLLKEGVNRAANPALIQLYEDYLQELKEAGDAPGTPWSYDFFDSGEPVSPETRAAYGGSAFLQSAFPFPRHSSNAGLMQALEAFQREQAQQSPVRKAKARRSFTKTVKKRKKHLIKRKLKFRRSRISLTV